MDKENHCQNQRRISEIYKETVWMYQYVKRYWFSICFYILAGIFGTVMGLGSSVVSKYLIDAVTGVRKDKILLFAVLIICMTAAGIISNAVISRISARINVVIQNEIQADIFQKLLYTEWKELQQFRSGDLLNRLSNDAVQVASGVISWIPNSITKLVQFIGAFAIIFYYDPVMAGIALLSAPVTVIFSRKFMGKMRTYNNEMREMTSSLMSFQDDTFQNIQTVKALDLTGVFEKKLQSLQNRYKEKMLDYNKFTVYTSSFMSAIGTGVSYICFGWSVYRLWSGYITTGTLLMFFQMANSLSSSFSSLIQIIPAAINAATCAGRLMSVSELEKENALDMEKVDRILEKEYKGITIELKEVNIHYKDGENVIHRGDFIANAGEITAVVGPSGEGKTTLIRVLLGLLHPMEGRAELKNAEGIKCRLSAGTREFFSYVPQGNTIFAGSIAENMRMVKEDATDEEIREVLEMACAYDFVKKLMNEKTKKEGYTDQLNQELLGTLGEKASSEQISAAYEKREVHRDTTYHKTNTKHASPWKDTAPAENTLKTRKKKHRSSRDRYFLLLSLGIAVGVLTAAGLLIYGSLLFLH